MSFGLDFAAKAVADNKITDAQYMELKNGHKSAPALCSATLGFVLFLILGVVAVIFLKADPIVAKGLGISAGGVAGVTLLITCAFNGYATHNTTQKACAYIKANAQRKQQEA